MKWQSDISVAAWLGESLSEDTATMHVVVPRGFAAYARIFHPVIVDELPGERLPTPEESVRLSPEVQTAVHERTISTQTTWEAAAAAFGTVMHPLAQWTRIVRTAPGEDWGQVHSPDGRRWNAPDDGTMPPQLTAEIVRTLGVGETPRPGYAALWEGRGGLVGAFGGTGRGVALLMGDGDDDTEAEIAWRHRQMLNASSHDPFNDVFLKPAWHDGLLSREISEGPRLELPLRAHVLFAGDLSAFASPDWILDVPWRDTWAQARGFEPSALTPALIWPEDRSWVVVSEIDYDSTIVGGSREHVAALLASPTLEAREIPAGSALHWDADTINH